jgi:arylsulfatase A-like enzyme
VVAVALALVLHAASAAQAERPNVIIFLVDDLGWMDTAVAGSRYYETPNIDRLARQGTMFTNAYAASPHCSPTRASILTGRYPVRLRITSAAGAVLARPDGASPYPASAPRRMQWLLPESRRFLPLEEVTLAEALKECGYRTAHIGKWHLGQEPQFWPDRQGFDVVFHGAPDSGPPSYFSPYGFLRGSISDGPPGEYITDRLTDEALHFIEANRDSRFLLHLWHFGVHGPWGHKDELRRQIAGRRDPSGRQGNAIMAAMIRSVDESLGRILDKLAELRLERRTLLVFLSDNGGAMHATMPANGMLPTNNAPLRGAKGLLYEGGVRVPLIISWPGVARPGSRRTEPVSTVDLAPTIFEAVGACSPQRRALDGESLLPLLEPDGKRRRRQALRRRAVFNYYATAALRAPPGATVHRGRWKLIRWFQTTPWFPRSLELYDLGRDIGETVNLVDEMPARARELDALIDDFLARTGALPPRPNPDFDPRAAALGGWLARHLDVEIEGCVLGCHASRAGRSGRLQLLALGHPGERELIGAHRLDLRLRAAAAAAAAVSLVDPASQEVRQRIELPLAEGDAWQEVSVELAIDLAPVTIRLELPAAAGKVEIDSILLRRVEELRVWPAFSSRQEWPFDLGG